MESTDPFEREDRSCLTRGARPHGSGGLESDSRLDNNPIVNYLSLDDEDGKLLLTNIGSPVKDYLKKHALPKVPALRSSSNKTILGISMILRVLFTTFRRLTFLT
jgi:hypothetical protein